jgi:hypothetical protein
MNTNPFKQPDAFRWEENKPLPSTIIRMLDSVLFDLGILHIDPNTCELTNLCELEEVAMTDYRYTTIEHGMGKVTLTLQMQFQRQRKGMSSKVLVTFTEYDHQDMMGGNE